MFSADPLGSRTTGQTAVNLLRTTEAFKKLCGGRGSGQWPVDALMKEQK